MECTKIRKFPLNCEKIWKRSSWNLTLKKNNVTFRLQDELDFPTNNRIEITSTGVIGEYYPVKRGIVVKKNFRGALI